MKLYLIKPDLTYFNEYNDMMREWCESKTQIAPWFLNEPLPSIEQFEKLIRLLDNCSNGIVDPRFCSTTSYFVVDENDRLVGAASLRHYLTIEGMKTWGHCGYGIRPSERRKGYATQVLKMLLEEAEKKGIRRVRIGAHTSNVGSCKTIEKCGFTFLEEVQDPDDENEKIRKYEIYNREYRR